MFTDRGVHLLEDGVAAARGRIVVDCLACLCRLTRSGCRGRQFFAAGPQAFFFLRCTGTAMAASILAIARRVASVSTPAISASVANAVCSSAASAPVSRSGRSIPP